MVDLIDIDYARAVNIATALVSDQAIETKQYLRQDSSTGKLNPLQDQRRRVAEGYLHQVADELFPQVGIQGRVDRLFSPIGAEKWVRYTLRMKPFESCSDPLCGDKNCSSVKAIFNYNPGGGFEKDHFLYLCTPLAVPRQKRGVNFLYVEEAWKLIRTPGPRALIYPIVSSRDASLKNIYGLVSLALTDPRLGKKPAPVELSRGGGILNPTPL